MCCGSEFCTLQFDSQRKLVTSIGSGKIKRNSIHQVWNIADQTGETDITGGMAAVLSSWHSKTLNRWTGDTGTIILMMRDAERGTHTGKNIDCPSIFYVSMFSYKIFPNVQLWLIYKNFAVLTQLGL